MRRPVEGMPPWTVGRTVPRLGQHGCKRVASNDFNRGIMRFGSADNPILMVLFGMLIFGGISALIAWSLTHAYPAG